MINSKYYIKSLNATESGETNTNDSYILVPKNNDATAFFLEETNPFSFYAIDAESSKRFGLRFEITKRNEQRIYKLGAYCRDKELHAGDIICLERRIINGDKKFIISYIKQKEIVLLQKFSDDLYLIERNDLNVDLKNTIFTLSFNDSDHTLLFLFDHNGKKRSDSPNSYDFFKVSIDGINELSTIIDDKYIIFDFKKNEIIPFKKFQEYSIIQN